MPAPARILFELANPPSADVAVWASLAREDLLMIRVLTAFVLAMAAIGFYALPAIAEDKKEDAKEVTLEGKITCPKCDLAESDKCFTVIKVKDKVYWFDAESNKKYHKDICSDGKDGKVTGKVKKDGDKILITVSKLEYKK
jgi:hypothetical protein